MIKLIKNKLNTYLKKKKIVFYILFNIKLYKQSYMEFKSYSNLYKL